MLFWYYPGCCLAKRIGAGERAPSIMPPLSRRCRALTIVRSVVLAKVSKGRCFGWVLQAVVYEPSYIGRSTNTDRTSGLGSAFKACYIRLRWAAQSSIMSLLMKISEHAARQLSLPIEQELMARNW